MAVNANEDDDDDKCLLSNEDDECSGRVLVDMLSGFADDEIDFDRWIGRLLLCWLFTDEDVE